MKRKKDWIKLGRKTIKHHTKVSWRWIGYDLMERVRKWAYEKHPKQVFVVRVDDDHFCNSDIVFITSERRGYFMGTNVIFIPQCTNDEPTKFFLYPGHVAGLLPVIEHLDKIGTHTRKGDDAWERKWLKQRKEKVRKYLAGTRKF
jgi:hypothetical protein